VFGCDYRGIVNGDGFMWWEKEFSVPWDRGCREVVLGFGCMYGV